MYKTVVAKVAKLRDGQHGDYAPVGRPMGDKPIAIWPGSIPGHRDPKAHFWYKGLDGALLRLCDDGQWPTGTPPQPLDASAPYVPCHACKELYLIDLTAGRQLLEPSSEQDCINPGTVIYSPLKVGSTQQNGVYTHRDWVDTTKKGEASMEIKPVPIAAFARFYEATSPQKVTMVRDARLYQSDPKGYAGRDYYRDLRNVLRQTHWQTDDISTFEAALGSLVSQQTKQGKKEHYLRVGTAYINYWRRHAARFFEIPDSNVDLAGLSIRVSIEVGMSYQGDNLALKLWLNAPRPTRGFRQAIRYLTEQGRRQGGWSQNWQAALWDVRREEVLPEVSVPKELALALEGQAGAFQEIWRRLDAIEQ